MVRGVTVTDRNVMECGGPGGEEEERLLQHRHCKDMNRRAGGLGAGV